MNNLRLGYGSEWHLLRYMGRHRALLREKVLALTGGDDLGWQDFGFTADAREEGNFGDAESKGLDFLPAHPMHQDVREAWAKWWPQTGNVQNWDAVGVVDRDGNPEWILVEAKANLEELKSETKAKEHGGLPKIRDCFQEAQQAFGADAGRDWTKPYYQYANRLAVLHFLTKMKVRARLLFIYFTGDSVPNRTCPKSAEEWQPALRDMKASLGLKGDSPLEQLKHELFLPVLGDE